MTEQPQQPQPEQPQQPQPQPAYAPGPQPMSQQDEKTWATLVHLAPFVAAIIGIPFLGPLIVFLLFKDRGPFVRFHAAQALNFQIITTIAFWVFGALSFVLIGIPFLIATAIAWVVLSIVAAIKANNGEWYRYPLTPELVK
ncbi:hypothetical protein SAMN04489867_1479 [Pedococcus dokdonensis]|uniref:Tic20 family protein n=1 Tax=Pedococcus dokdonensis TaxID=443156 RepID=A0A1H0Q4H7_9MICO|nr:DUF4870 domain-containing protein [Pedococcus dokdonensis]SDP12234.1 hypothetical protein SAMN04489867_1479 [Pedococcus dokdonensis]